MQEGSRNAPLWFKLFVGFHVIAITSWALPKSAPGVLNGAASPAALDWIPYVNDKFVRGSPTQQYVLFCGLWQSWDMFAPNPTHKDVWMDATVEYKSGRKATYTYPRVYEASLPAKYVTERYRKYYERAHLNMFSFMRVPMCQYIARLMNDNPADLPAFVTLQRHITEIPHPTTASEYFQGLSGGKWLSEAPPIPPFRMETYYIYGVQPEDLK